MISKENLSPSPFGMKEKADHHSCSQNKSWEPEGNKFLGVILLQIKLTCLCLCTY